MPLTLAFLSLYTESVLTTGAIFAIAGAGLYVTLASGQFSVAHAALMGLGGYSAGVAALELGWSFSATLCVGVAVGALSGAILGTLLRRMSGMLLGIATLAIGQAISLTIVNVDYLGASVGYSGVPLRAGFVSTWVILAGVLVVLMYLRRTRFGLALLAVGKDETVAEALGISSLVMRIWAFGLGGAFAGLAGALLVQFVGLIQPNDLAFAAEVQLFIYVIVGGLTTPWGAALGAVGTIWLLEALRFSTLDRYWILGLILVLVVVLRPRGILVRRNIRLGSDRPPWWRDPVAAWRAVRSDMIAAATPRRLARRRADRSAALLEAGASAALLSDRAPEHPPEEPAVQPGEANRKGVR